MSETETDNPVNHYEACLAHLEALLKEKPHKKEIVTAYEATPEGLQTNVNPEIDNWASLANHDNQRTEDTCNLIATLFRRLVVLARRQGFEAHAIVKCQDRYTKESLKTAQDYLKKCEINPELAKGKNNPLFQVAMNACTNRNFTNAQHRKSSRTRRDNSQVAAKDRADLLGYTPPYIVFSSSEVLPKRDLPGLMAERMDSNNVGKSSYGRFMEVLAEVASAPQQNVLFLNEFAQPSALTKWTFFKAAEHKRRTQFFPDVPVLTPNEQDYQEIKISTTLQKIRQECYRKGYIKELSRIKSATTAEENSDNDNSETSTTTKKKKTRQHKKKSTAAATTPQQQQQKNDYTGRGLVNIPEELRPLVASRVFIRYKKNYYQSILLNQQAMNNLYNVMDERLNINLDVDYGSETETAAIAELDATVVHHLVPQFIRAYFSQDTKVRDVESRRIFAPIEKSDNPVMDGLKQLLVDCRRVNTERHAIFSNTKKNTFKGIPNTKAPVLDNELVQNRKRTKLMMTMPTSTTTSEVSDDSVDFSDNEFIDSSTPTPTPKKKTTTATTRSKTTTKSKSKSNGNNRKQRSSRSNGKTKRTKESTTAAEIISSIVTENSKKDDDDDDEGSFEYDD